MKRIPGLEGLGEDSTDNLCPPANAGGPQVTYAADWLLFSYQIVSDSATQWIASCQASLSLTNSQSLPSFMNHCLSRQRGLPNSVELWAMPCRATQDRRVIVESSDKMRSPGGGNSEPLQWTCLENSKNCIKQGCRQDSPWKSCFPRERDKGGS